ncbi:CHAT domain-containing protein [Flammeovirga sp. MY04]|uniref:CHAT domain-containing protein n=1 Tax=Flammeovirga sp. MY04 TaxID=1191459 RepID=UPI0008063DF3|nr:CHAT domain-containing protein [Flammeovirga sp. MY04]ANQ49301.1 CHAT domain-containing protein [Flammeovirga sp. MY04]
MLKYFILLLSLYLFSHTLFANQTINPDVIKSLQEQGRFEEAKKLANTWISETENEYGDHAIEVVIPLLVTSELSILHYEYFEAIELLNKSIEIMDKSSGWLYPDYALALNYLAFCKINVGDAFAAFPILNEAEMIYYKTLTQQHPDFNLCNINRAILNMHLGEFQKSEDYFNKSFEFAANLNKSGLKSKSENTISKEWLYIYFAKLYTKWYKPEKAIVLLEKAQAGLIEDNCKKSPVYAILLEALANHYFYINDYKMSYTFYNSLISHRKEHFGENQLATIMAYLDLGKLMAEKGYLKEALNNYSVVEKNLSKFKNNSNLRTELMLCITDIHLQKGDTESTKQYLDKISKDDLGKRELYYHYLKILGEYYFLQGDYINAELNLMELVSIVRQEKVFFTEYYSEAIVILSDLFITLGRTQSAIGICETEVRFLKRRGMENSVVYQNLKLTLLNAQFNEDMLDSIQTLEDIKTVEDQLTLLVNPKHPLFIKSNTIRGEIATKKEEFDQAIAYFHKAIEIANYHGIDEMQYQRIKIIDLAGSIFIRKGELDKALDEYRVIKGKFTEESVYWPGYLGRIAYVKSLLGEWEEAKELAIKGVDMRFKQYDTQLNFTSEDEKINYIHHTSGIFNYFFSLMTKREGFKSQEMVEKCYDLQINYRKYFLKESIARKAKIDQLGKYRNKMNFSDYVNHLEAQKSKLATANYLSVKERNDLHINSYMLTDRINNLEKSLSFASETDEDSLQLSEYVTWKDVQDKLDDNEVAVEIIKLKCINPKESFYVAIAVSSDCKTPQFIPIGNAALMENDLFTVYTKETQPKTRSLVFKSNSAPKVSAYDLYWKPIQKGLDSFKDNIDKIYISKDGIYNAVNLNVLYNKETKKYLIEEEDIELVISTSDIQKNIKMSDFKNNEICLFGNPAFEESSESNFIREVDESSSEQEKYSFYLTDLPGTKTELENTENLFKSKGWNVSTYYRNNATEGNIKNLKNSPAIMHIATHGIYIDKMINPILQNSLLKSGLFFTEVTSNNNKSLEEIYQSGNDGLLTAYEVKDLDLKNTSLLILSACQSGVSDISDGDGISGLQYAFSIAGVESIVMSLWSVDDLATQKLMNEFYKQWFETKDIDKAFRAAQIKMMKEYKDPYYWGAFVMVH